MKINEFCNLWGTIENKAVRIVTNKNAIILTDAMGMTVLGRNCYMQRLNGTSINVRTIKTIHII
jgi:UDP-N-acetyl-D-mannosaminuronic acid transferase (WecB/TagA/CpsF family)